MAALDIRKDIIGFCENTCVAVGSELKSLDLYGECTCENGVEIYPHDLKSRQMRWGRYIPSLDYSETAKDIAMRAIAIIKEKS